MKKTSAKGRPSAKRVAETTKPRSQPRPRLTGERLDLLLDAAADVFTAQGFDAASTNEIARRASASKLSIYSRYPTKADLFIAVLEHRMNRIFREMTATIPDHAPLHAALFRFGKGILRSALSDGQVALLRVVSMETVRFPQLGQRFFELGPGRGIGALATYLQGQINKGVLREEDPTMMAQHYIGMIAGPSLLFSLLGVRSRLARGRKQVVQLEQAIEVFKRAYARP